MKKDFKFMLFTACIMIFMVSILHLCFFLAGADFFLWTYPILAGGVTFIIAFHLLIVFPLAERFDIF